MSSEYEAKDLPQSELIYGKLCEKQSHVDSPKPKGDCRKEMSVKRISKYLLVLAELGRASFLLFFMPFGPF